MDFTAYRGTDVTLTIPVADADGAPVDLTGASLRFTAKYSRADADADAVLVKETATEHGPGVIDVPPGDAEAHPPTVASNAVVTIAADDWPPLTVTVDDVEVVGPPMRRSVLVWGLRGRIDDATQVLAEGTLVCLPAVTQATP